MEKWIVPELDRHLAADRYHAGHKPEVIQEVEAVIIHFTGSKSPTGTRKYLTKDDENFVSVHFIDERNGTMKQTIPLDERGAHAGGRTSRLFGKGNVNGRTLGIEMMNVGPLVFVGKDLKTVSGKDFYGAPTSAGGARPSRGDDYPHTSWEAYPPRQLDALVKLLKKLVIEFPILETDPHSRITGHENVDPSRKMDPGPAFPWEIILQRVFNFEDDGR